MQTTQINLGIQNPSLSALASRTYKPGYTQVPDSALPRVIQDQLKAIFLVLTGRELPPESSTLLVKASSGVFERIYTPTLFKRSEPEEGQSLLYIKWGAEEIDLQAGTKAGFVGPAGPNENLTIGFAEVDQGRGKDTVLQCEFVDEASNQALLFSVQVRFVSYDKDTKPEISALNILAKRNVKELAALIAEAPKGGSGGGLGTDVANLRDLELGSYLVTQYRAVNTKYGVKYIVRIAATPELGRETEFECWGDKNINATIGSDPAPIITPDKPARLTMISKTALADNKWKIQASLIVSDYVPSIGGLNLNFD